MHVTTTLTTEIHRFYNFIDSGRYEEAAAFFEEDGELVFGPGAPKPGSLRGDEIRAALVARRTNGHPMQRHVVSNMLVEEDDKGFYAQSLMIVYRFGSSPYPVLLADVTQRWRRIDGKWKMAQLIVMPVVGDS